MKSLPWAPGSPAYQPEKNQTFSFDLDKAKSLLQEAGVSTTLELEMVFNSQNAEQGAMSQIWQSDLQKIGVTLKLRGLESAVLLPMWHNQTYKGFYIASDAWTNMQPITFFTSSSVAPNQRQQRRLQQRGVHRRRSTRWRWSQTRPSASRCSPT